MRGLGSSDPAATLVSIIIDNYNYGRFLGAAIESALAQTHPNCEVVVVDDGSTDESRQVIARYGDRVRPVLKDNGGQLSAFNAGFAASAGALICFLDADDVFLPGKVEAVLRAWRARPGAAVLYHQLRGIDAQGRALWGGKPWPWPLRSGDIRAKVERSGGWWLWPNTSGLCFPRWCLERVLPGPPEPFRYCADAYLAGLAPFLGPVAGIASPLTAYRLHGKNWVAQLGSHERGAARKAANYEREHRLVSATLRDRLGLTTHMSLDDHYMYQYYRRVAGQPVGAFRVLSAVLRCPLLPPAAKIRQGARVALSRM